MIGLGIDTGGTCTDAVIFDLQKNEILDTAKTLTTKTHLETGIGRALDLLDASLLRQAELISLSTTLATNACIENRGGRVKLLFIGVNRKVLRQTYQDYGFESLEDLIVIDGMPEGGFMTPKAPDWEELASRMEAFAGAQAVGVVQSFPEWNHGAFEKQAAAMIREHFDVPVVCGSELFSDLNAIRRGAGTYLNIRLIPVIRSFLQAVKKVAAERELHVPIYVVRSDGTLMNEAFAETHPVETLLCGPAASALGGAWMAGEKNALIVDIGGTTTDVAIMQSGRMLNVADGIKINGWKTFVKGMYIDTFGLGGDSAVRFDAHGIYLEPFRVIPVSMLAVKYPQIKDSLEELKHRNSLTAPFPYEGFVLQQKDYDPEQLEDWQIRFLEMLKKGPVLTEKARDIFGTYVIDHGMKSLEQQNIVMRFGLTPTDMMHIKGDFAKYDIGAAQMAAEILSKISHFPLKKLPDMVYQAFVKKLTVNLERILVEKGTAHYPEGISDEIRDFLETIYDQSNGTSQETVHERSNGTSQETVHERSNGTSQETVNEQTDSNFLKAGRAEYMNEAAGKIIHDQTGGTFLKTEFRCSLPVIGVGGPAGVFIPPAAKKLQTRAFIHPYASVANAVGTLTGKVTVISSQEMVLTYENYSRSYRIFVNGKKQLIRDYEEARKILENELRKEVTQKARNRGIRGKLTFESSVDEKKGRIGSDLILVRAVVTVSATGSAF